jgi:hypothetical protein
LAEEERKPFEELKRFRHPDPRAELLGMARRE